MSLLVNGYLSGPLWVRSMVTFLLLFVFWIISGRIILWILSLLPFVLRIAFRRVYLLFEIPLDMLHKGSGSAFGEINNQMSQIGGKIDDAMLTWYHVWHSPEKLYIRKGLLCCIVCVLLINFWHVGKVKFLGMESFLVGFIMKQDWYDSDAVLISKEGVEESTEEADIDVYEIELVVSGLNSSLLIRRVPSIDEGEVLGKLYNDDVVIWTGQMVFAEVNDRSIEPWVKIRTSEGIEGWSRLYYLHPAQYENLDMRVSTVIE